MDKKFIFNSSLPRAGSQLISTILAQNPSIFASGTSPVIEAIYGLRQTFPELNEFKAADWITDKKQAVVGMYRGILNGFYSFTDRPVVLDKSRGWINYYELLSEIIPNPKIICCVRDIRAILSSMEKLRRKQIFFRDGVDDPKNLRGQTINDRVKLYLNSHPLGLALQRLYDFLDRGLADNAYFLVYENFCKNPEETMKELYDYLELPYFRHDFENIITSIRENDSFHGEFGDHQIRTKLEALPPDYYKILGKELSYEVKENTAWFYEAFYTD